MEDGDEDRTRVMTPTSSPVVSREVQRRKVTVQRFLLAKCYDCIQAHQRTRLEPLAGSGLNGGLRDCSRSVAVKMLIHRCHGVPNANDPLTPCHARSRMCCLGFARNGWDACCLFSRALPNQPRMSRGTRGPLPEHAGEFRRV
jgi:hypothetical protein